MNLSPADSQHRFDLAALQRRAHLILVMASFAGMLAFGWGVGVSVLLGGGLAFLNFQLKRRAIDGILGGNPVNRPSSLVMGFVLGLLLIFLCLFAIIHLSFLSLYGALVGLSVYVAAGLLEAVLMLLRR